MKPSDPSHRPRLTARLLGWCHFLRIITMATFDVTGPSVLGLWLLTVDSIITCLLLFLPLFYGIKWIAWFWVRLSALSFINVIRMTYLTYHKTNHNVNLAFPGIFCIACIIFTFDGLVLLVYVQSFFVYVRDKPYSDKDVPEDFLTGFHTGTCFAFLFIAIYESIRQKLNKMYQNRNAEEPATPDQVETQIEEEPNANLENPVAKNNDQPCGICLEPNGEALQTLIPCGHYYYCTKCVDTLPNVPDARCPCCREPIIGTM